MITVLLRTVITYTVVFFVMRLMGKRQLSDMQPFDLVVSLLIADAASAPITDPSIPLLYGTVPILALFLLHGLAARIAMKSEKLRRAVSGRPVVLISDGKICEEALKAVCFTVYELSEQLRLKDVFSFSEVGYCIMETNGSLSVLKKNQVSTDKPALLLAADGKLIEDAASGAGFEGEALEMKLKTYADSNINELLYLCIEADGSLILQKKAEYGGNTLKLEKGSAG